MRNLLYHFSVILLISILFACSRSASIDEQPDPIPVETGFLNLEVPNDFEFKTTGDVMLEITDSDEGAYYYIYTFEDESHSEEITYVDDEGNEVTDAIEIADHLNSVKIGMVRVVGGKASLNISVPTNVKCLLLQKRFNKAFVNAFTDDIPSQRPLSLSFNGNDLQVKTRMTSNTKNTSLASDILWCVNGSGQLFTVNPDDMTAVRKPDLAEGTWTVAMDYQNHQFYTIGRNKPYKLYRYDVDPENDYAVSEPTIINSDLGFGGPRLEYANDEGFLYFSNKDYIYKLNPADGSVLETFNIDNGLNNTSGGDIAKGEDGSWYMSTFGGLYALTFNEGSNEVNAVRKSADNLPFTPTSLCIDTKTTPDIWVADNFTPSSLYVMDTQTGGYETRDPDNELGINDLTKTPLEYENVGDSDNDGCPDDIDQYPNDPEICLNTVTPTKYGWGSLAFEDMWPSKGDYDFNDLVVNYRYTMMLNIDNKAVKMEAKFWVRHVKGASFNNGFGIQFDNLLPSQIESVSGYDIRSDYIQIDQATGLEANQGKPVVIVFDQSQNYRDETSEADPEYNEITISIRFTNPIAPEEIGSSPFNPFLIVNGDRKHEIHLPNQAVTSLGNNKLEESTNNLDPDGDYRSENGLPWAIAIVHEFKFMKEKVDILEGYNHFSTWAESGGELYPDWYKDNAGYRNNDKINR
ncbi:LruC domain-containing protein [Marinifilum caeruleilacunae]|uniref:LruC domain-containing protein n=1 Tax=Marinifilum caeruleilacunae TaxID=2499076 RepID=A0ABX1WX85_9BACT|nr:LruC domain-containing protein [Marinifilum caeruleilacunae]NOU60753.1 LruC domain-containing protein [Marinifilum caeruleilacunae]